jgi:hypothetical protein
MIFSLIFDRADALPAGPADIVNMTLSKKQKQEGPKRGALPPLVASLLAPHSGGTWPVKQASNKRTPHC